MIKYIKIPIDADDIFAIRKVREKLSKDTGTENFDMEYDAISRSYVSVNLHQFEPDIAAILIIKYA